MNDRQKALFENHYDVAQLACSGENNVFWILDLDDPLAFKIAKGGNAEESLTSYRDNQRELGNIAASTMTTPEHVLHTFRETVSKQAPIGTVPDGFIAVVLISEGAVISAFAPSMAASMAATN